MGVAMAAVALIITQGTLLRLQPARTLALGGGELATPEVRGAKGAVVTTHACGYKNVHAAAGPKKAETQSGVRTGAPKAPESVSRAPPLSNLASTPDYTALVITPWSHVLPL